MGQPKAAPSSGETVCDPDRVIRVTGQVELSGDSPCAWRWCMVVADNGGQRALSVRKENDGGSGRPFTRVTRAGVRPAGCSARPPAIGGAVTLQDWGAHRPARAPPSLVRSLRAAPGAVSTRLRSACGRQVRWRGGEGRDEARGISATTSRPHGRTCERPSWRCCPQRPASTPGRAFNLALLNANRLIARDPIDERSSQPLEPAGRTNDKAGNAPIQSGRRVGHSQTEQRPGGQPLFAGGDLGMCPECIYLLGDATSQNPYLISRNATSSSTPAWPSCCSDASVTHQKGLP
jgi:hypothetical protein